MEEILKQIEEKKNRLKELKAVHSKAHCSSEHSSAADVNRELEREELEDAIKELEKQV